jgi:hypothetical protein
VEAPAGEAEAAPKRYVYDHSHPKRAGHHPCSS